MNQMKPPCPPDPNYIMDMYAHEIYEGEEYYSTPEGLLSTISVTDYVDDFMKDLSIVELAAVMDEIRPHNQLIEEIRSEVKEEVLDAFDTFFDFQQLTMKNEHDL